MKHSMTALMEAHSSLLKNLQRSVPQPDDLAKRTLRMCTGLATPRTHVPLTWVMSRTGDRSHPTPAVWRGEGGTVPPLPALPPGGQRLEERGRGGVLDDPLRGAEPCSGTRLSLRQ